MSSGKHLLFELGCEELPPKTLQQLSHALLNNIKQGMQTAGLDFSNCQAYATPRRLAVIIKDLAVTQPSKTIEKRGPAIQAAFLEDGSPSKATQGFSRSCGTTVEMLHRLKTDKGEWLAFNQVIKGKPSTELIPDLINKSLSDLPIAKRMRWGASETEFVRPVHWAVLLYGEDLIEAEILGIKTGTETFGHRFHAPQAITLKTAAEYPEILYQHGKVIADIAQRKTLIREAAHQAAQAVGGIAYIEEALLDEVSALNEWPVPITGNFDARYLDLPAEVLITTMQVNQKYFPVKNVSGELLPHFITFSNIESSRPESIQEGNERVINPRLADAEFFWQQDTKTQLQDRITKLSRIIFQKKLGTLADKTQRLTTLAEFIAQQINADSSLAKRAAQLAKTDLMTEMVGEFPSLQGVMGHYYALKDGEPIEVAEALEEQYFPKQSGSPTPKSSTGQVLSLAEKIDTLCGIFSAGLIPTGDKDPYALRRAALGTLRVIIENKLELDLHRCIDFALQQYSHDFNREDTRQAVLEFIQDRFKGYCLDNGFKVDEFEAVRAVNPTRPLDFERRLQAVKTFRQMPEASSLAAANKRIRNILKKSTTQPSTQLDNLIEPQEIQLLKLAKQAAEQIQPLLDQQDYPAVLAYLAQLRNDIDAFFDNIMVMVDDQELRSKRLGLLTLLSDLFLKIADISKLQS
jgi:glycyl-tRNA synthetase beta chain